MYREWYDKNAENKKNDSDLLWLFSGLSMDYILNICCVQAIDHTFRQRFSEIKKTEKVEKKEEYRFCKNRSKRTECYADAEKNKMIFAELKKKSIGEFYSLLALDNLTYREQLQGDIFNYLRENAKNTINPWGYFDFRLPRYQYLIERAVNNIVNGYLEQRDYERCIKVIEAIAVRTVRKTKILHVVFTHSGGFILLNENNEILEAAEIREELANAKNLGLKLDDVLTAVFVYYAPERIVVHNFQNANPGVSPMIWELAGVPVDFCSGCKVCFKYIAPVFLEV